MDYPRPLQNEALLREIALLRQRHAALEAALIDKEKEARRLRDSELKYKTLYDQAAIGIIIADQTTRILDANGRALELLGYSLEELKALTGSDLVHPDDQEQLSLGKTMRRILAGEIVSLERRYRKKDGTYLPARLNLRVLAPEHGQFLVMFEDITDRKQAEQRLLESRKLLFDSQAKLSLAMDLARLGQWDYDIATDVFTFNDQFYSLYATTAEREGGYRMPAERYAREFLPPEDVPVVAASINRVMASAVDYSYEQLEHRILRRDGEVRTIVVRFAVIRDETGRPVRTIGANQDITDRKRAEEALTRREAYLRAILDNAPFMMWLKDTDSRFLAVNDVFAISCGETSPEAVAGKTDFEVWPPDLAVKYRGDDAEVMAAGRRKIVEEFIEQAGKRLWFETSKVPVRDGGGRIIGTTGIARNITARKETEAALLAAKEAAEATSRAKSEFLATMSHEIRTPLNGVLGMLQLVQGTALDHEQKSYVDTAVVSAKSLLRVLSDILDLSRIEAGRMPINVGPFDLAEVIQPVVGSFMPEAAAKGLAFGCDLDPRLPPTLLGDAGRIRQVLYNLVANAIKYTERGGVRLEVYPLSGNGRHLTLHFAVIDTGIGIPADKLPRVFESFTQVDGSRTRRFGGSGLGLTIAKRLLACMDGSISLCSEAGRGTEAHVSLRLGLPRQRKAAGKAGLPASSPSARTNLTFLVVEDERINLLTAQRLLKRLGHRSVGVMNGEEALAALEKDDFDAVLMDIQMPVLDGLETTKRVRGGHSEAIDPKIPVIAMTAHAMAGDREQFLAAGMDDYIAKPVDLAELTAVIERVAAGKLAKKS